MERVWSLHPQSSLKLTRDQDWQYLAIMHPWLVSLVSVSTDFYG